MEGVMQYLGQYAIKSALVAAAYFAPCKEVIAIVFLFWLADLVFGILASKNRHAPRSSRRMRKSVGKLIGYMAAILLAFLIDKLVPNLWIIPHRLMAAYLCVCELISILENLAIITQAKAFVSLIKLIRGKNDENVIYDLINEKNADYSARSPLGRVQPKSQTAIFADGSDRYGDRDRTGAGYGGRPRTRPVDDPGASRVRQCGPGADAQAAGVSGGEPTEASRHRGSQ
ncbi:phage holin family protein [Alistipes onderdonkii]|uniref:phage holin family protein n=1 Tax=Alistipes onderdonkii TaxID=328813 RepID=UPI0018AADE12|nr:phage holin family protein [Alistipes onderdonkii]